MGIVRDWLRRSPHVHVRERGVSNLVDLVGLIDRFVDGTLQYRLEWDDFISWTHDNPNIESIRQRITETEPLFSSKDASKRVEALGVLIRERNCAAALSGLPARALPPPK